MASERLATLPLPRTEGDPLSPAASGRIYDRVLDDILAGLIPAGARLKVGELAARYGTSTNPVREALQQLRGEGFVVIEPNRGARVRPIDESFVRDMYEINVLIEPYLVRWFADYATDADIARMEAIQDEIEALGFERHDRYDQLDEDFHRVVYDRHYNRNAVELWHRYRKTLGTISRGLTIGRSRYAARLAEHRELIRCLKQQDTEGATRAIETHVRGSGRHIIDLMRSER
ncbi:GntR family transcriptional regulator [Aureimonas jatrophae]|uniref:DNA-binding transcriptional regulator, GntR family n=1 Tax=Aureimonas jatrophae TaxID=1166073 RepID=A0A1H0KQ02_9HYPH|nr:GntR family transcriptional regulator [Aureimonas jatrophae]MBB3948820.1 DNA-binding GntR family transcriptional regulator [Aureimonas jatrophae]SDO58054.1 DNA-binding transcriptional regulator, GntR family [Aureimonas jatrophae]